MSKAPEKSSVWHWLESAGLERFYANFTKYGVSEDNFTNLSFQDYDAVGVTDHAERQKLFKLIQVVKRELEGSQPINVPANVPAPSASAPPGGSGGGGGGAQVTFSPQAVLSPPQGVKKDASKEARQAHIDRLARPKSSAGPRTPRASSANEKPPAAGASSSSSSNNVNVPPPSTSAPPGGGAARPGVARQPSHNSLEPPQPTGSPPPADDDEPAVSLPPQVMDELELLMEETKRAQHHLESAQAPSGSNEPETSKIRVVVRKRPMSSKETAKGEKDIIVVPTEPNPQSLFVHEPKTKVDLTKYVERHKFIFDEAFAENDTNEKIYERTCKPLISFFMNQRGRCTCFAYGQTGSGKTFTMMGPDSGKKPNAQTGIYLLAAHDIFKNMVNFPDLDVWVSFYEIYGGKLFDLLNQRRKLVCREDSNHNIHVVGLEERVTTNVDQLVQLMEFGNSIRSTGQTGANLDSSRSHAILQFSLRTRADHRAKRRLMGKFSFIDLAGSERGADTMGNDKRTRIEGAEINKSLLALKECIRALDQDAKHRPFRGSKLTQVLKDSLVGNSRTIMIANISPNVSSVEHTLNTLRYADRVKELKKEASKKDSVNAYMPHQNQQQGQILKVIDYSSGEEMVEEDEDLLHDVPDDELFDDAEDESKESHADPPAKPAHLAVANAASSAHGSSSVGASPPATVGQAKTKIPRPGAVSNPVSGTHTPNQAAASHAPAPAPAAASSSAAAALLARKARQQPSGGAVKPAASAPKQANGAGAGAAAARDLDEVDDERVHNEKLQQDDLMRTHEKICSAILEEEDQIVEAHRRQIDDTMKLVKEEMQLLKKFDSLGYSVDEYVQALDAILAKKIGSIQDLRNRIAIFRTHLKEEEMLSSSLKGGSLNLIPDNLDLDGDDPLHEDMDHMA